MDRRKREKERERERKRERKREREREKKEEEKTLALVKKNISNKKSAQTHKGRPFKKKKEHHQAL